MESNEMLARPDGFSFRPAAIRLERAISLMLVGDHLAGVLHVYVAQRLTDGARYEDIRAGTMGRREALQTYGLSANLLQMWLTRTRMSPWQAWLLHAKRRLRH